MIKINNKTIVSESTVADDRVYGLPDVIFVSHSTYKALEEVLGAHEKKQEFKKVIDKKIEDLLEKD